ncbi:unnamed protein product, partial [Laminaria digitata]
AEITDWSVGAIHADNEDSRGGHLYVVEFANAPPSEARMTHFAKTVDTALSKTNEDYEAHRSGDFGMRMPDAIAVPPGTFAAWMKSRGQLGGQHKVPRIINDTEMFDGLREFVTGERRSDS